MLVYHPAYDPYHCIMRILKTLKCLDNKERNIDRIRIYDYYLLFPNNLDNITIPAQFSKYKKLVVSNRYNKVDNPNYIFNQLISIQNIAFRAITSFGFIDKELFDNEIVKISNVELPSGLLPEMKNFEEEYFVFIKEYLENLSLRELKYRTKVMDYRYELT